MKRNDVNRIRFMAALLFAALVLSSIGDARADFTFGEPTNLGANINTAVEDGGVSVSPDGLELYVSSFLDGFGVGTFRRATRETTEDPWGEAVGLEPPFRRIVASCISANGLELYFDSDRAGGSGGADIWMATRASTSDPWENPVNLGTSVNSADWELGPSISADGLELYFGSSRSEGSGDWDVWVCTRATPADAWSKAVNVGPTVNSSAYEGQPCISANGLMLFISTDRIGGYGDWDVWMSRRSSRDDHWSELVNLGPTLNSEAGEAEPFLSSDEKTLYFSDWWIPRDGGCGTNDVWQVSIEPVVDFNGDGVVDSTDMSILVHYWGQNEPLCDIGPTPLGDGVVDVHDLIVLAEHLAPGLETAAHWKLDESSGAMAHDSVGGSDATMAGGATWRPEDGVDNGALELDGVDDHVTTDFASDPKAGPVRVACWIKTDAPGGVIVSQTPGTGFGSTWLATDPADGTLLTEMMFPLPALHSTVVVTDGQWHEVTAEWDGTYRRLWADNQEVARDALPVALPPLSWNGTFIVGAGANLEVGTFFSGLIDDVRIYNRAVRQ
jgi:hypothetical protein